MPASSCVVDARSETELGTLRAYSAINFQWTTNQVVAADINDDRFVQLADVTSRVDVAIDHAYLELGGFRIGKTDSLFSTFTGYAGGVINDDLIPFGPYDTFQHRLHLRRAATASPPRSLSKKGDSASGASRRSIAIGDSSWRR